MAEAKKTATSKAAEVVVPGKNISTGELADLSSFDEALKLVTAKVGETNLSVAAQDLGDGFKLLENKDQLNGVAFIAVTWDFHNGDFGEFVSVKLMTRDGQKMIVNDGSTGICEQLREFTNKKGVQGGMFCEKGLRRSDYKYTDEKGVETPASTWYIDTSA